jgi:RNA polymerase sigma-70 factor, ECF subfamily
LNISFKKSEDYALVQKAKKNRAAFSVLYDKYFVRVFQFVYKRIGDKELTADLTSQTFLKAMLHLEKYQDRGVPFIAWLLRIASNELNMHFRKSTSSLEVSIDDTQLGTLAHDVGVDETDDNFQRMIAQLNQLSLEESQMVELRFFDQCSFAEMANIYGITEANMKMKLYRILKKMRKNIESR